jgi:hypothetical protein
MGLYSLGIHNIGPLVAYFGSPFTIAIWTLLWKGWKTRKTHMVLPGWAPGQEIKIGAYRCHQNRKQMHFGSFSDQFTNSWWVLVFFQVFHFSLGVCRDTSTSQSCQSLGVEVRICHSLTESQMNQMNQMKEVTPCWRLSSLLSKHEHRQMAGPRAIGGAKWHQGACVPSEMLAATRASRALWEPKSA